MVKKTIADILRKIVGLPSPKKTHHRHDVELSAAPKSSTTSNPAPLVSSIPDPTTGHAASPANSKQIEWGVSATSSVPTKPRKTSLISTEKKIEWGGSALSATPDLESLIGIEDAYEHTPLVAGERIAFCKHDRVAYHFSTWEFLRQQNHGRCCICGKSDSITLFTLPGQLIEKAYAFQPTIPEVSIKSGEKIIGLKETSDYINLAVIVQDFVQEVYCTKSTGTYFVRFEKRRPSGAPFHGFKVVIFSGYERLWNEMGMSIRDYAGHTIRVRGVIQKHPDWGIEILVNSPRVIQIID